MSFLDTIESGIDSLLDPLTETAAATSANLVDPITTSTADSETPTTTTTKSSRSSKPSSTATSADSRPTSSAHDKSTAAPSSAAPSTITSTSSESSTSISSTSTTSTTISTSSTSSSSSPSTSTTPPPAPSAQPTISPAQSSSTQSPSPSSGPGISTAGIVVAAVIGFALLASIIFLIIRFCPPVRKRIDAWYEKRREERTWRAAIDGIAAEKGEGSLSSAGGSSMDKIRPFSFFAAGKDTQVQGQTHNYHDQASSRDMTGQQPPSYISPTREPVELYTPTSADRQFQPQSQQRQSTNTNTNTQGTGLGLGRVSLLRNTSLLRKAGFDAPSPQPQLPRQLQLPQQISSASIQTPSRMSQAQLGRIVKPTTSQIRRKPLPVDPPGMNVGTGIPVSVSMPGNRTRSRAMSTTMTANPQNDTINARQRHEQRQQSMSFGIDRGLIPLPLPAPSSVTSGQSHNHNHNHSRAHSRNESLPKLQIHIPGSTHTAGVGGRVQELASDNWDGNRSGSGNRISQSQIGVAVGSPLGAVHPGRRSR